MVGAVPMDVHEVEVDGRPVRYRVTGTGPPLVLVHGLAGSWRWWSRLLRSLGEGRGVHLVDLPRLGRRVGGTELTAWLGRGLDAAPLERVDPARPPLGGLPAADFAPPRSEGARGPRPLAP